MKLVKIASIVVLVYVCLVAILEGVIWYTQPEMPGGVIITTTSSDGTRMNRTLAGFRHNGKLYVASNHWLRTWYHQALANPNVEVTVKGIRAAHSAVPIQGAERDELSRVYEMGFVLRLLCAFAPSKFLRLDPVT